MFPMKTASALSKILTNYQLGSRSLSSVLAAKDEQAQKVIKRDFADCEPGKPKKLREVCGKNVVYIGGLGGIGFAACREIAGAGAKNFMIVDREANDKLKSELEKCYPKCNFDFLQLDLTSGKKKICKIINECAECVQGIDILVNGAGVIKDRTPKVCTDINLVGLIESTMAAIPTMSKKEGGRGGFILNVASVLGLSPGAYIATYTATKHAIIGFTRACADPHYFEETCIVHAAVCPGYTVTPMITKFDETFEFSKKLSKKIVTSVKTQPASDCGKHIVTILQSAKNGEAWISDLGELYPVKFTEYWEPQYEC